MAYTFNLPDIGEGLEEAEIILWLVAPGDKVERDQPLVEVLTDKASSELPSPVAGTVLRLGAAEGDRPAGTAAGAGEGADDRDGGVSDAWRFAFMYDGIVNHCPEP